MLISIPFFFFVALIPASRDSFGFLIPFGLLITWSIGPCNSKLFLTLWGCIKSKEVREITEDATCDHSCQQSEYFFFCCSQRHSISLGIFSFFVAQNIESRSALSSSSTTKASLSYLLRQYLSLSSACFLLACSWATWSANSSLDRNRLLHLGGMTCLVAIRF